MVWAAVAGVSRKCTQYNAWLLWVMVGYTEQFPLEWGVSQ